MISIYTFGDSILDCGMYNRHLVNPGALIVQNRDDLFPEFRGRDLSSRGPARLVHRAFDGSIVHDLPGQAKGLAVEEHSLALVTVGGNDLLQGLVVDDGPGIREFAASLDRFLDEVPIRRVFIGNVFDPTLGDDARNFLGIDPVQARDALDRMNKAIASVAARHGTLVDLHAHFLTGEESWFTRTIEPSLIGASEVRRCFLDKILGNPITSTSPAAEKEGPRDEGPKTGAYFWVPRPGSEGLAWELVTCHDFDFWDGISHREFWPLVVPRLAAEWGKEPSTLESRLRDCYWGLPRGRVTHPGSGYLIIHGDDAPVADWLDLVKDRFRLSQVEATLQFTEHQGMSTGDRRTVQETLGYRWAWTGLPGP